jgi:phage terminase large subunit GpA-like protein
MNAVNDPRVERIVVMKASRIGVTEAINNIIGYFVHEDPCPMLFVQQTLGEARKYVDSMLQPMIDETPALKERIIEPRTKDFSSTKMHKTFPGGNLTLVGADSPRGFRMVAKRVVILDDIDGFESSAGSEGDPIDLAIKRADTFWNKKILMASSPTIKDLSRIESAYRESDMRVYEVPCPFCQKFQVLDFFEHIKWTKDRPETAHCECKYCHKEIQEHRKPQLLKGGRWKATAPFRKTAGFHIAQLYSPWVTWVELAEEFLKTKNNPERFQVFYNTKLGLSWEDRTSAIDEYHLLGRRDNYGPKVPQDVGVLTCAVDVQDDRLECETKGWGRGQECWGIDFRIFEGTPAQPEVWEALDMYLLSTWDHESGAEIPITCTAIDTGGHHTDKVYDFCKPRQGRLVLPVKGANRPGQPIIRFRNPKAKGKSKYGLNPYMVGSDTAKSAIFARLRIESPGPGYMHFPMAYDEEYFRQLVSETVKTKMINGIPRRIWVKKSNIRNEALDLNVYNFAALKFLESFRDFSLDRAVEKMREYRRCLQDGQKPRIRTRRRRVRSKGVSVHA